MIEGKFTNDKQNQLYIRSGQRRIKNLQNLNLSIIVDYNNLVNEKLSLKSSFFFLRLH